MSKGMHMIFILSLIFWELIKNQTILALDYLKSYKLQAKFFSKNFDRFARKAKFKEKDPCLCER
jgi:hypothetical protein